MSQPPFSAHQCFEQLLTITLTKLDKLESIINHQRMTDPEICIISSLIKDLRQQVSRSQIWLVDHHSSAAPLDLARAQLQSLTDQLQSSILPIGTRGAVGMITRSLNTYLNLLNGQAVELRYQHLSRLHRVPANREFAIY